MNHLLRLFVLICISVAIQSKLHRMQIHRDSNALKTMGSVLGLQQFIAKKHNMNLEEDEACEEEIDTFNATFYGYVFIGTPPQQVIVNFDTSNNGLVVTEKQFDPEKSKTAAHYYASYYLEDPITYAYQVTKNVYTDFVGVADLIIDQNIPVFETSIGEYAIFGLGVNSTQSIITPPLKLMYNENAISSEIFSMYLLDEATSATPQYAGEVIFGGSDPNAYNGSLHYINLISLRSNNYAFNIDQVSVGGKRIATGIAAIIDSGSEFISTPILPYALLNTVLGGVTDSNGNYFVNCSTVNSLPNVDISIAGQTVSLKPSAYILNIIDDNGDEVCMSAFAYSSTTYWVLGTPFMVNNYFEFDVTNQRIGWAPAAAYSGTLTVNIPTPPKRPLPRKICKN